MPARGDRGVGCKDGVGCAAVGGGLGGGARELRRGMRKGLVGERFKRRGMRWSAAGANAVLALRAAVFNDRCDDFRRPPDKAHPLAA